MILIWLLESENKSRVKKPFDFGSKIADKNFKNINKIV